jgi:alpha-tubulin suppressor-like RCC1 family protein
MSMWSRGPFAGCCGTWVGSRLAPLVALAALVGALAPPATAAPTGQLYSFGANNAGQLGNSSNIGTFSANPTPTPVSLPGATGEVTQVAAGGGNGFSLVTTTTGQLYAFGDNGVGELGRSPNTSPNPTPMLVTLPGATGPVIQTAGGWDFSLAVTSTGQLYSFGQNASGQLGYAPTSPTDINATPQLVTLPGATGPVAQVAAGWGHSLAVTTTGQLYAFGDNFAGELGNAVGVGSNGPNPTPTLVRFRLQHTVVVQAAAGFDFSLALTSTGQLYSFGYNLNGQLGTTANEGTENSNSSPTPLTLPGETGPVTQIAAGFYHSLALTSTGQLYAFGYNQAGQLGNATNSGGASCDNTAGCTTPSPNPTPTPVTLPGAQGQITQIAAGFQFSFALTSTGQLYAFGDNEYGQLGTSSNTGTAGGATTVNPTPTEVTFPFGLTPVAVATGDGALHTLVIVSGGIRTATALTSSVNPATTAKQVTYTATIAPTPNGGTVAFTDNGATIPSCGAITLSSATGEASCHMTYGTAGSHMIVATYSGDANYTPSASTTLLQWVNVPVAPPLGSIPLKILGRPSGAGGEVTITESCGSGASNGCVVADQVTTTETIRDGKPVAVSAVSHRRLRTIVVGRKTVKIRAGHSVTVHVVLNRTGEKLLKHFGKLPVKLVVLHTQHGKQVTLAKRTLTVAAKRRHVHS